LHNETFADSKAPFFAGTKVPSMKASRMSIPPRSDRFSASPWAMRLKTPDWAHCWNRLWQVWYGGYRCGKSFHGAPVGKIHNIPFKTSRGSRSLRPRGSLLGFAESIMGSMRFHCSFVSSILILIHNQNLMSRFFLRQVLVSCMTYSFKPFSPLNIELFDRAFYDTLLSSSIRRKQRRFAKRLMKKAFS
jgi:hypothetical protein